MSDISFNSEEVQEYGRKKSDMDKELSDQLCPALGGVLEEYIAAHPILVDKPLTTSLQEFLAQNIPESTDEDHVYDPVFFREHVFRLVSTKDSLDVLDIQHSPETLEARVKSQVAAVLSELDMLIARVRKSPKQKLTVTVLEPFNLSVSQENFQVRFMVYCLIYFYEDTDDGTNNSTVAGGA